MGVFILFILFVVIVVILGKAGSSGKSSYHGGYSRAYDYDEDFDEDYDDYSDSEIRAARGERDYFSDDPSDDYNSYYAQVADDAMMGDRDAMDEMYGEFGDW
ncbi:hypothetical protein [Treponema bryantii]|uniref:hypothetical protein n=1 Tax=Treponema bryantii TaxID=163 RepID=UPI0003B70FC9|nr:hypothetical protein [Treponema bryantii]